MVEQGFCKSQVVGPIPTASSIFMIKYKITVEGTNVDDIERLLHKALTEGLPRMREGKHMTVSEHPDDYDPYLYIGSENIKGDVQDP